MDPLATRRLAAYALDMTCCLGIAAATVPLGLALRRGRPEWISEPTVQALSAVPVVAATAWAAWAESGSRQGTPGKRAMGLRTEAVEGGRLPLPRAAVRATAKVAIPGSCATPRRSTACGEASRRRTRCSSAPTRRPTQR